METTVTPQAARPSGPKPSLPAAAASSARERVQAVDLLRGLVMVLMALDHVRDYFSLVRFDPTDLTRTTVPLFFTRWITHFCAPVFILLAGASAWMAGRRRSPGELSRWLFSRGLWLILLELTVVNFAWYFNLRFEFGFRLQVIWAIGVAMVALSVLVLLPRAAILAVAVVLIGGNDLLDRFDPSGTSALWWALLHKQQSFPALHLGVTYPVLSLIGVMAAGYVLGPVLERPREARNRTLVSLGLGLTAGFVVLRWLGIYGDPAPWTAQQNPVMTALSFLNTTKYPASLQYLSMTLGPALLALPLLERLRGQGAEWLATFGRAPLFYYVTHLYLIHLLVLAGGVLTGFGVGQVATLYRGLPLGYGFSLPVVYLIWIGVVVTLYRPTRWFGRMRQQGRQWWWSYL